MDYKKKYLKYKSKYLELKNQHGGKQYSKQRDTQNGGNIDPNLTNYQHINPNIFSNNLISIVNCVPSIYNSIEDILSNLSKFVKHNGVDTDKINPTYAELKTNLDLIYGTLFETNTNLYLTNAVRKNNIALLNSLYIHTICMGLDLDYKIFCQQIKSLVLDYFTLTTGEESIAQFELEEFFDNEYPSDPYILASIYSNIFGCKILLIKDNNKNYLFEKAKIFIPNIQNEKTDHIIIIQSGEYLFLPLILSGGDFKQRADLFNEISTNIYKITNKDIEEIPSDFVPNPDIKSLLNINFTENKAVSEPVPAPVSEPVPEPVPKPLLEPKLKPEMNKFVLDPIIIQNNVIGMFRDKLQIYENVDDLISLTDKKSPNYNTIENNLTKLYGPLFNKFKNLLLINARGDGYCFLNSLFIFIIMKGDYQENFYNLLKTAYNYDNDFLDKSSRESYILVKKNKIEEVISEHVNENYKYNQFVVPEGSELEKIIAAFNIKTPDISEIDKYLKTYNKDKRNIQMLNTIKTALEIIDKSYIQSNTEYKKIKNLLESTINITNLLQASNLFFDSYNTNNIDVSYYIKIFTDAFLSLGKQKILEDATVYGITDPNDELIINWISEMKDINTPDINFFSQVFNDLFKCNVLVLELDSYLFNSRGTRKIPDQINTSYDNVVIIKTGGHFQILVLYNSTDKQRKQLYDDVELYKG